MIKSINEINLQSRPPIGDPIKVEDDYQDKVPEQHENQAGLISYQDTQRQQLQQKEYVENKDTNENLLSDLGQILIANNNAQLLRQRMGSETPMFQQVSVFTANQPLENAEQIQPLQQQSELMQAQPAQNSEQDNQKVNPWKRAPLMILMFVNKAVNCFIALSKSVKFRHLNQHQFNIIQDHAADYKYYRIRKYFVNDQPSKWQLFCQQMNLISCIKSFKHLYRRNFITQTLHHFLLKNAILIMPESHFNIIWEWFILFLLIMNIFYIPLRTSFEKSHNFISDKMIHIFLDNIPPYIYIIDVFLRFNTAIYLKGVIVTNREIIIKQYFFNQFFWDLVILIPYFVAVINNVPYLEGILLLRSAKIFKLANSLVERFNLRDNQQAIYDMIKLVFTVLLIAHICGCVFHLITDLEEMNDVENTWVARQNLNNASWFEVYVATLYWAVITMLTVGYGDIVPVSTFERIVCIIITLISCGVFGYALNQIGNIILSLNKSQAQFKSQMTLLTAHMKKRNMSNELQTEVKKYFEYLHYEELEDNEIGHQMLDQLMGPLKKRVLLDIYGKILKSRKLFTLNFSQPFLDDLTLKMKEKRIAPEVIIFKENEEQDRVYFLMSGEVQLLIKKSIVKTLHAGECFGRASFFSGQLADYSAKTENVVSLIYFNRQDFMHVLHKYQQDYETFCQFKDNYNFNKDYRGVEVQCAACFKYCHNIRECQQVNFHVNKDMLIARENHCDEKQLRHKQFTRSEFKGENTIGISDIVREGAIQYLYENREELKLEDAQGAIQTIINSAKLDQEYDYIRDNIIKEEEEDDREEVNPSAIIMNQLNLEKSQNLQKQISQQSNVQLQQFSLQSQYKVRSPRSSISLQSQEDLNDQPNINNNSHNTNSNGSTHNQLLLHQLAQPSLQKLPHLQLQAQSSHRKSISSRKSSIKFGAKRTLRKKVLPNDISMSRQISYNNQLSNQDFSTPERKGQRQTTVTGGSLQKSQQNFYPGCFSCIIDFDKYHYWKTYFPHGNFMLIIKQYNKTLKIKENEQEEDRISQLIKKRKSTHNQKNFDIFSKRRRATSQQRLLHRRNPSGTSNSEQQ